MKKITLSLSTVFAVLAFFLINMDAVAQSQFNPVITGGSTSGLGRAPQGSHRFTRSHFIVTAAEMTTAGFSNGDRISGLGFTYVTPQSIPTTGSIKIYLENTTNTSNTKSTNWTTAITGMTLVSDGATTVPAATGDYNIEFVNGSSFVYGGGSIYVAFDYQNLTNPLSTPNAAFCLSATVGGAAGVATASSTTTTAPVTLTRSNFRPQVRLAIPVACARPTNLGATNPTPTSATLTWNPIGGTGIEVEYGLQGFTLGTGTLASGPTVVSPYTVNGLVANTVYDYYVRTICPGSVSNWNGPFTFTSLFQPSNVPYNTSFENTQFPFFGWIAQRDPSGTVGNFWQTVDFGPGSPNVQNGNFIARTGAGVTTAVSNDWIISRGINLTAGATATIEFYVAVAQTGTTTPASYKLTVGTAQNAAAQTTVIFNAPTFSNPTYQLRSHTYTVPATGVYYFGIQNATPANPAGSLSLVLDNFTITQTLSVDSIDANKFTVYPNPATDLIAINSSDSTFNNVQVVDLNGRIVKTATFENVSEANLNIASLSAGVYLLNISNESGTVTKKIVKE